MRMFVAGINLELLEHSATQRRTRQHAFDSQLQDTLRRTLNQFFETHAFQAARKTGVVMINLGLGLVPGHANLVGVDHHDVITGIHVRRILRLVFATQAAGNLCGNTAQSLTFRIEQQPVVFNILWFGTKSLHVTSPKSGIISREREYYRSAEETSSTFNRAHLRQGPINYISRTLYRLRHFMARVY